MNNNYNNDKMYVGDKMKKNIIRVIFVLMLVFSLGLNILLLYDKLDKKAGEIEVDPNDVNNTISVKYNKESLGKLFRDYQATSNLAKSDDLAVFEVTKITYVGYFKSDKNKKLYYIDEKFSCVEGTECLDTVDKVEVDKQGMYNTRFVVSVSPVDENDALFEILDYSIENNSDFQKDKHEIMK